MELVAGVMVPVYEPRFCPETPENERLPEQDSPSKPVMFCVWSPSVVIFCGLLMSSVYLNLIQSNSIFSLPSRNVWKLRSAPRLMSNLEATPFQGGDLECRHAKAPKQRMSKKKVSSENPSTPAWKILKLSPSGCFVTCQTSDCNPWISSRTAVYGESMGLWCIHASMIHLSCTLPVFHIQAWDTESETVSKQKPSESKQWKAMESIKSPRTTEDFECFIHRVLGHSHPLHIPQVLSTSIGQLPLELSQSISP